jgi:predicted CxxxxCH...CXXCH cytochrome family protein
MVATPAWGSSPAQCSECHDAAPSTGSHSPHLAVSGIACDNCHDGTVQGTTAPAQHRDDNIDVYDSVSGDLGYPENKTKGSAYASCSTASCHGGQTPTWGADFTGIDTCTKCHGTATASPAPDYAKAPPADLSGDTADTDDQVGAHQAHLQSTFGKTVACSECHTVPSNPDDAGHYNDGTPGVAELNFGSLASANSASPSYAGGQCSTTYCHGNAMPKGSSNGNAKTPSWNNNNYLSGTPSLAGDCSQCHGSPPNVNPHGGGETLAQCATCHEHFNPDGTLNDQTLHINGLVDVTDNCNSCHGYPPTPGDGYAYRDAPTSEGKGAHTTHINNIAAEKGVTLDPANDTFGTGPAAAVCGVCHSNNMANHMTGTRVINFGDGSTVYQFGPVAPVYNGVRNTMMTDKTYRNNCSKKELSVSLINISTKSIKEKKMGKTSKTLRSRTCMKLTFILAFLVIAIAGMGITDSAEAQFTVTACTDCHGQPPADGSARNTPAGAVIGSTFRQQVRYTAGPVHTARAQVSPSRTVPRWEPVQTSTVTVMFRARTVQPRLIPLLRPSGGPALWHVIPVTDRMLMRRTVCLIQDHIMCMPVPRSVK